jgi:N-acetylglucosaminyl-diphospho-decaprenol L-rhamnosyltransferase
MISISVVSHGHGAMVARLVPQLFALPEVSQVIVTRNVQEPLALPDDTRIVVRDNSVPKGFGANHNAAFRFCEAPFFCVLNPDIDLPENPFPELLRSLVETGAAMAAPRILTPGGLQDDSVRIFPTPLNLLRKALFNERGQLDPGLHHSPAAFWVAGMFMLWRREAFAQLGGFDEGFFLYYEDVDLCARVWKSGLTLAVCGQAYAIHDARRESHRNFRFMRWHAASMLRYLIKHTLSQPRKRSE